MNDDKWLDLKESLKEKFNILEDKTEDYTVETEEGSQKLGTVDILISETPMGKIKLERTNKPVVLDKKVHYNRRKEGSQIEYIYSEDELTHHMDAFKWNNEEGTWQKIDASSFQ